MTLTQEQREWLDKPLDDEEDTDEEQVDDTEDEQEIGFRDCTAKIQG